MTYTRRASPLHATRAAVAAAWCLVLAGGALVTDHPVVLAAGAGAGVLPELGRAARYAVAFAALLVLINPFVASANGLTVVARLGPVPILPDDITLEAIVEGGVLGLRAVVLWLACALGALCVDPDAVLALFRRRSLRTSLSIALATRLVPVLQRDARRLADAQRCRPGPPASRLQVVRAVAAGALDRAVDVAATLEVRGYGSGRAARRSAAPWSRHDVAFAASALGLLVLFAGAQLADVASFAAYPLLHVQTGAAAAGLCAALAAVALAPFFDRRGIEP